MPSMVSRAQHGGSGSRSGGGGGGKGGDDGGGGCCVAMLSPSAQLLSSVPHSLLLYLQSAPTPVIFAAFQADCSARGLLWYSTRAQKLAVALFVNFAVSRRYPPRYSTLRSLLKQYITRIEQPHVMQEVLRIQADGRTQQQQQQDEGNGGDDDPVLLELMEAYIHLSVMEGDKDHSLCYKTFFNPYLLDEDAYRHRHDGNSGSGSATTTTAASAAATTAGDGAGHSGSNSSTNTIVTAAKTALAVVTGDLVVDDLRRQTAEVMVRRLFCSVRVASRQYSNVGLSVWPAAFVLVQLLAQELRGTTHLLTSLLFPRHGSSYNNNSNNTSMSEHSGDGGSVSSSSSNISASFGRSDAAMPSLREHEKLHILELGAGVGLTPILLHRLPSYQRCVSTFVLTDYQAQLTDNIRHNLHMNHVTVVEDLHAAAMGLEGDKQRPFHAVVPLAWGDTADVESLLVDWGCDVALAADCIYDVDVIPALVSCIRLVLTLPLTHGGMEWSRTMKSRSTAFDTRGMGGAGDKHNNNSSSGSSGNANNSSNNNSDGMPSSPAPPRKPVCVIVQTHRQNSTMKVFFDAVREFAQVRSYSLVRGTRAELLPRMSARLDGADGGLVPLGEWHNCSCASAPSPSSSPSSCTCADAAAVLCALQPDQVLSDGSMLRQRTARATACGFAGGSSISSGDFSLTPSSGSFGDLRNVSMMGSGGGGGGSALGSTTSRLDDVAVDIDALLRDEMIGPFYVPMAGLVGVHVLQSK